MRVNPATNFFESKEKKVAGIPGFNMARPLNPTVKSGDVGIEIEVEGGPLPLSGHLEGAKIPSGAYWVVERDGSLRNGGLEYKFSKPVSVKDGEILVDHLYKTFESLGAVLELSNRTSTHVHLNVSGLKINEVTAILVLWSVFEESIIEWCGETRKTNHFCLSNKDSRTLRRAWNNFLQNGVRPEGSGAKYCAFNILPMYSFGSVEVRCAPAFADPVRVKSWLRFLHTMKKYALERFDNPQDIASAISETGGTGIFREICARADANDFCNEVLRSSSNFDYSCLEGLRRVQNILFDHPWHEWLPLTKGSYSPDPFDYSLGEARPRMREPNAATIDRMERTRRVIMPDGWPPARPAPAQFWNPPPQNPEEGEDDVEAVFDEWDDEEDEL